MKLKPFGNIVEGPQGLRMPESLARQIEDAGKGLPKDFTYRRRAKTPTEFTLEAGARTDLSVVSTDAIDHQKEVVMPGGIDFEVFRQNPVVPFAHNYDALQVGKCLWIKSGTGGVKALTKYAECPPNHQNWLPDAIVSLMKDEMCKGKSIGFIPTHVRTPTNEEIAKRPELKSVDAVIDSAVLLEYSVAPVPCNPDALVIAVGKSVKNKALADLILSAAKSVDPETVADEIEQAADAVIETIVPFVSPQTIADYRKRLLTGLPELVKRAAESKFTDAIDRMRGRV